MEKIENLPNQQPESGGVSSADISRRRFVQWAASVVGVTLTACVPAPAPRPSETPSPTPAAISTPERFSIVRPLINFIPTPERWRLFPGQFTENFGVEGKEVDFTREFISQRFNPEIIKKYGYELDIIKSGKVEPRFDFRAQGRMGYFDIAGITGENPHVSSFASMTERNGNSYWGGWKGSVGLSVSHKDSQGGLGSQVTEAEITMLFTHNGSAYGANQNGEVKTENLGENVIFKELEHLETHGTINYAPHSIRKGMWGVFSGGVPDRKYQIIADAPQLSAVNLRDAAKIVFKVPEGIEWNSKMVDEFRHLPDFIRNPLGKAARIPAVEGVSRSLTGQSVEVYMDVTGLGRIRVTEPSQKFRNRLDNSTSEEKESLLKQKADAVKLAKRYIFPYLNQINWEEIEPDRLIDTEDQNQIDFWALPNQATGSSLRFEVKNIYDQSGNITERQIRGWFDPKKVPVERGDDMLFNFPDNLEWEPTTLTYESFKVNAIKATGETVEGELFTYTRDEVGNFTIKIVQAINN